MGLGAVPFESAKEIALKLFPYFARNRRLAFVATGVVHSLACAMWSTFWRRQVRHVHMVQGGAEERDSYGRKRRLNHLGVTFVACSRFVRERLVANGVRAPRIRVIENFLSTAQLDSAIKRAPFRSPGVKRLVVVSRLDPIKRVDLLLDAFDQEPALNQLNVAVLGSGSEIDKLRARAEATHPRISIEGFRPDVDRRLAASDLLVHLCPTEPFGLASLEAMAAGVPALVPNAGGAGDLVKDVVNGFRFNANDARSLADRLLELSQAPSELLNRVVEGGRHTLATRFSATARLAEYRELLQEEESDERDRLEHRHGDSRGLEADTSPREHARIRSAGSRMGSN
jgi:glycosyltransferase involved in cell wall biosynthesis